MHVATSHLLYISSMNGNDARIQAHHCTANYRFFDENQYTYIHIYKMSCTYHVCVVIFAPSDVLRSGLVQYLPPSFTGSEINNLS